jgi:hypothetical protein
VAETYWPTTATQLDSASKARQLFSAYSGDGVVRYDRNLLAVFADSSGMLVKLPTGSAVVAGAMYNNDAQFNITIGNGHATLPRIDRIVLRYTFSSGVIAAVPKAGTANATPVPPTLQRDTSVWELSLAQVAVAPALSTSIASSAVTSEAPESAGRAGRVMIVGGGGASGMTTNGIAFLTIPPQGFPYRVTVTGSLYADINAAGTRFDALIRYGPPGVDGSVVSWGGASILDGQVILSPGGSVKLGGYMTVPGGDRQAYCTYLNRPYGSGTAATYGDINNNRLEVVIDPL